MTSARRVLWGILATLLPGGTAVAADAPSKLPASLAFHQSADLAWLSTYNATLAWTAPDGARIAFRKADWPNVSFKLGKAFASGDWSQAGGVAFEVRNPESTPLTERYFSSVQAAVRKHAPRQLYLGCRFSVHPQEVVDVAARYCDVESFNIYADRVEPAK